MFVCFHLELAIYNSKISKNGFTLKAGLYPAEKLKTKTKNKSMHPGATFMRHLATFQRCLATFQQCLANFQRCLSTFQRCLSNFQQCLSTFQRCL